jgi:hypothetical protein
MRLAMLLVVAGTTAPIGAWAADHTAGAMAAACQAGTNRVGCIAAMEGFHAGYITGIEKGIRSTFANDAAVLQTTDGNEDTYLRYRKVAARTTCIPAGTDGAALLTLFLDYVKANPDTAQEPFGDVMEVTLDSAFRCSP